MDKKEIYEHYNLLLKLALLENKEVYDYYFKKLISLLSTEELTQFAMEEDLEDSFYQ